MDGILKDLGYYNDVILLDGGMGQELRRRATNDPASLWSAQVLIDQPDLVTEVHQDYIEAGANVITTNTYATVRHRLAEHTSLESQFEELVTQAVNLARSAVTNCGKNTLIAGSLPPLWGSYMPERVQPFDVNEPIYRELAELIAPGVDLLLCETMSTSQEARAAAVAACATGKPVWISWTVADDSSGKLRSGETIEEAWNAVRDLAIEAVLVNCSSPEAISISVPHLCRLGVPFVGAYANGFAEIPAQWSVTQGVDKLGQRENFTPEAYARHVESWLSDGANIVGGCCEVGPEHIAYLSNVLAGRDGESD